MKIAACVIVKDDSELVKFQQSALSYRQYVDEWHVVTNGEKTDGIKEFVESLGGNFYHLPWSDDFSAQRNFAFSKASKDVDYIYWQDADDVLVGGERLRALADLSKSASMDLVFLTYWYGCRFKQGEPSPQTFESVTVQHERERLLRPGTHVWKGLLHETPIPVSGTKNKYTKYPYDAKDRPIAVMHLKTNEEAEETMERNKRILELQLSEEKKAGEADPRTLLYLMKIYSQSNEDGVLKHCLTMGEEYLRKSGWDEERAVCAEIMGLCYEKLGDPKQAIRFLHTAIENYPYQVIHYIRLASAYFDSGDYRAAKHWMDMGASLPLDSASAGINNFQDMKILFAQLLLKLKYQVEKDVKGAVEAAKLLYNEMPTPENNENMLFLMDMNDMNEACRHADYLTKYLEDIGRPELAIKVLESLPTEISSQPFSVEKKHRLQRPRVWDTNEVCYFANFGQKHFEQWGLSSLQTGIGGSETAVLELAREWAKRGFKVTIYGDPEKPEKEVYGDGSVEVLPWYEFNRRDHFNVFIQWRNPFLAGQIKCREYYLDLHDVVNQVDFPAHVMQAVDGVFFKSLFHRQMLYKLPDEKAFVISNGISNL